MKLLHAADFHLDSPLSGLPPEKSALRRRELREIPARLAKLARDEEVDLVLLPGDLFDGQRAYPETVRALAKALEDMEVPVFIAPGNHDYYNDKSPYATADWPDNVYIFTQPALEGIEMPGLNCVVYGCAFTSDHREDNPIKGFTAPDDGRTHLLCVHGEVRPGGTYAPISRESLERCNAAYAALGHIHAPYKEKLGSTLCAYSGCPEGRGFDEMGVRGAYIVTIDGGKAKARFVETCKRKYVGWSVSPSGFAEELPQGESPDIYRFQLIGESLEPPDLAALTALAAPHFFHVEVLDHTRLPQELWARGSEDSLTGLFLREMRARLEAAEGSESEKDKLLLAARFGLAALEGGEDIRP